MPARYAPTLFGFVLTALISFPIARRLVGVLVKAPAPVSR